MADAMPDFEEFNGSRSRAHLIELRFHLRMIHLSAMARHLLGNPARVVYLCERTTRQIGIRAAREGDRGYALTKNGTVAAGRFLDWIDVRVPLGTLVRGEWDDKRRMLVFPLPEQ